MLYGMKKSRNYYQLKSWNLLTNEEQEIILKKSKWSCTKKDESELNYMGLF